MSPEEIESRRTAVWTGVDKAKKFLGVGRTVFACLIFAVCAVGLGSTFWLLGQSSPAPAARPATSSAASALATEQDIARLQQEAKNLRDEAEKLREESVRLQAALDGERREADGFRWLLTAIVGLGALYGLFQGLYSYFNVQGFNNQADRIIKDLDSRKEGAKKDLEEFQKRVQTRSESDFEKFRKDCEVRYPLFIGLESALGRTAAFLASRFGSSAVGAELYRPKDKTGLEEIYYYERSAAALEYMGFARGVEHILILRGFSSFYLEKHRSDHAGKGQPGGSAPDPADLVRARFYLDRARILYGANFRLSNAFGALALQGEPAPDLDRAQAYYEESIALEPHQQHARYGLAWILDEKAEAAKDQRLYEQVVMHLRLALQEANWEDYPIPARVPSISYNLACGLCRLAAFPLPGNQKDDLLKEAADALLSASKSRGDAFKNFAEDRKPDGDLGILNQDARYKQQLDDIATAVTVKP